MCPCARDCGASLSVFGTRPDHGRTFRAAGTCRGLHRFSKIAGFETVAIISDALWQRRFDGDRSIIGKSAPVNGRPITIIGVMPPRFAFPERHDLWLPYAAADRQANRDRRVIFSIGLLHEGMSSSEARAEIDTAAANLAASYPDTNRGWGVHMMPLRDFFVGGPARRAVSSMLAAVALVLLVACANVAGIIVARGLARQKELTIRAALGAGRARLIRLVLAETTILAAAGGLIGLFLAHAGVAALVASSPDPPPYWAAMQIDARVIAFVILVSALTALACGLLPAFRISRVDPAPALQSGRSSATASQRRLQSALVAAQVAVSLALLVGGVLLSQSAMRLQHGDAGFDPEPLLSMRIYIPGDAYDELEARARVVARIVEGLSAMPGVASAAATGSIPADDGGRTVRLVPPRGGSADEEIGSQAIPVSPEIWPALGLRMIEGRTFTDTEALDSRPGGAVIVNQRLASRFWPGQSAIGRELLVAEPSRRRSYRVVGVAPDIVYEELGEETEQSRLNIYLPYAVSAPRTMALLIRASESVDPATLAGPARETIRHIDPAFATYDVLTMRQRRQVIHWAESFLGRTFAAFAIAALLLACIGAYGLSAYAAEQRRREIGVRVALGARRPDVVRLLVGRGTRLALLGLIIGIPLAAAAAMLLEKLLFDVDPWQTAVWIAVPALLLGAVLGASYPPAHKASLADPAEALRHD